MNNINEKKWSPKIFKILSIFRLNSEVNVFHYALEVCVFTMFRSGNILTILRGHIVVLTFKPKYTHLLHIATIYRVWSEIRYCAHPPPLFLQKKVSNPSNRAKYHLRSYFMRYLAKTNTFLWNNMISALGATIQKKIDFTLKNYETPLKCAIICFVSEADIILSWNAKFRFNMNNINDKKWSPKIFKILSIFRLNSEVNVFHYALEVCVFTMFRSGNILTILRGHIVVLTFKPKYTHLLHIATIYRVWSETRYCAHPPFSYKKSFKSIKSCKISS